MEGLYHPLVPRFVVSEAMVAHRQLGKGTSALTLLYKIGTRWNPLRSGTEAA